MSLVWLIIARKRLLVVLGADCIAEGDSRWWQHGADSHYNQPVQAGRGSSSSKYRATQGRDSRGALWERKGGGCSWLLKKAWLGRAGGGAMAITGRTSRATHKHQPTPVEKGERNESELLIFAL